VSFHHTIVEAAGNPALEYAAAGVLDSLQPAINLVIFRFRDRAKVADQHERLHLALEKRDAPVGLSPTTCSTCANNMRRHKRHVPRQTNKSKPDQRAAAETATSPGLLFEI